MIRESRVIAKLLLEGADEKNGMKPFLSRTCFRKSRHRRQDARPPLPKPVKFIKPAIIAPKNYIETEEDIEEFLKALKQELLEALKKNSRIRIQ